MYARKHRKNAAALLEIIPESHFDHGVTPAHIDFIKEKFADKTGFFIETVQLPAKLPSLQDALYGPLVGDKPVVESAVHYAVRGIRPGESRMIDKPMRETRIMTVIAGPHDGKPLVLYTAFGGKLAPKEPFDPTLNPAQKAESEAFWSQHALATGKQAPKRKRSNTTVHAHDLDCPTCGAPAGYYCNRPNGTALKTPHKARHSRKRANAADDKTCGACYAYDVPAQADQCPHCGSRALHTNIRDVRRGGRVGTPQAAPGGVGTHNLLDLAFRQLGRPRASEPVVDEPLPEWLGKILEDDPHKNVLRFVKKRDNAKVKHVRSNPHCFQFINKMTGVADNFPEIDDQICAFLGVKPDPVNYYMGWYDTIGFRVAMGDTFDQIREDRYVASEPKLIRILDWLDARYTTRAWYERK
jgi:hypothetical protein